MSYFQISVGYQRHPKILKLKKNLGAEGVLAHLRLLEFTAINKLTGFLKNMDTVDIEIASEWSGTNGSFADIICDLKLIDEVKNGFRIHNWKDHNSYIVDRPKRVKIARNAARIKWQKNKTEKEKKSDYIDGADSNANGNARGDAFSLTTHKHKQNNSGDENISPDVLDFYKIFFNTVEKPLKKEVELIKKYLDEKPLNFWIPYIKNMRQAIIDGAKPPGLSFWGVDYNRYTSGKKSKKQYLYKCPECNDDKGMVSESSQLTSHCSQHDPVVFRIRVGEI